jgi:hypothetical protein
MTLVYAEKGSSETVVPVQTTSEKTIFLNCLHRYDNSELYIEPNVKWFLLSENINTET